MTSEEFMKNGTVTVNTYDNLLSPNLRVNANAYVLAKLCPEDKDQLNRIEALLYKKKEYVQLRINK